MLRTRTSFILRPTPLLSILFSYPHAAPGLPLGRNFAKSGSISISGGQQLLAHLVPNGTGALIRQALDRKVTAYRDRSGVEDVMDLERLVDLAEPFGAVGCPATATLIERKLEL